MDMPIAPDAAVSHRLDHLFARTSVKVRHLREPSPSGDALDIAVAAAACAPDHGALQPWRFVFIAGDARLAFGDVIAESLVRRAPETPPERIEIERAKPLRAPLLVVAGAAIRHDRPGVPRWEQEASAAAGTMNFLHALDAQGFGAIWLSSPSLQDPAVKAALGFAAEDTLLGYIYAGTPEAPRSLPPRPEPAPFRRWWAP
jgi:nitroreductase